MARQIMARTVHYLFLALILPQYRDWMRRFEDEIRLKNQGDAKLGILL